MENKNIEEKEYLEGEEQSGFNFQELFQMLVLNWQWIVLSVIICCAVAFVYLRYTTPVFQVSTKLLVKDNDSNRYSSRSAISAMNNLGMISNSNGIDNEIEILKSTLISEQAVRTLDLHTMYYTKGRMRWRILYKTQPITAVISDEALDMLEGPILLEVKATDKGFRVKGEYYPPRPEDGDYEHYKKIEIDKTYAKLPAQIPTTYGFITLEQNGKRVLDEGDRMKIEIYPPSMLAISYANRLAVEQSNRNTTIAILTLKDISVGRGIDYLNELVNAYNQQANDDKNEIARRTEEFINERLQKVESELGHTDGSIESFKRSNKMIELSLSANETMKNSDEYDQKLTDINTQISLINSLSTYIDKEENKYQVIPSNIGLTDGSTTALIANYNKVALDRSSMLRTASDINPALKPLTAQLDELHESIKQAMAQAKKTLEIQQSSILSQYNKYQNQILNSPEQQRVMTEIGRQQEVQTALYTMLLQKREENSISLAATANKGQLIDKAVSNGKVSPKGKIIMAVAFVLGLLIPIGILYLLRFLRYKIEGHDDVAKLTTLPIIADVPIANDAKKSVGEIVVYENSNSTMEEIFRSMRTNLQFMLEEGQKVIMSTSSISGEGKTFITSNLAISFALLGKKVILIGMDIRKPRLAELFRLKDRHKGVTPLLSMAEPTRADVLANVVHSNVNDNLDILMAGPIPPNPAEILGRSQLDKIIEILKGEYDYILLDTAPVGLVTDTLIINRVADLTIAVVRADYTPKENVQMLTALAQEGKMANTAVVINGIDMSKKKYGYYYGYGKYAHYGKYSRRYSSYGSSYSYGGYGRRYGYGHGYGGYGYGYGKYGKNTYADKNDNSVKL
ncbi:MAG: polysaccharide biosynthesis tyrosine autokinase [Prevotella sp.]|nr:polysaccharide biosynthesis tyrosine autokinase [Prevotella sp.]